MAPAYISFGCNLLSRSRARTELSHGSRIVLSLEVSAQGNRSKGRGVLSSSNSLAKGRNTGRPANNEYLPAMSAPASRKTGESERLTPDFGSLVPAGSIYNEIRAAVSSGRTPFHWRVTSYRLAVSRGETDPVSTRSTIHRRTPQGAPHST